MKPRIQLVFQSVRSDEPPRDLLSHDVLLDGAGVSIRAQRRIAARHGYMILAKDQSGFNPRAAKKPRATPTPLLYLQPDRMFQSARSDESPRDTGPDVLGIDQQVSILAQRRIAARLVGAGVIGGQYLFQSARGDESPRDHTLAFWISTNCLFQSARSD